MTIGDGAVIGACSLVKEDVPPMTLAFGVPARVVRSLRTIDPNSEFEGPVAETLADASGMENYAAKAIYTDADMEAIELSLAATPLGPGLNGSIFHPSISPGPQSQRRGSEQDDLQRREEQRERVRKAEIGVMVAVGAVVLAGMLLAMFFAGIYIAQRRICISTIMGEMK